MDEYGARPDAIQKAHREAHLSALYLQPIIQNPLGVTMNATRRADIMRVAEKLDLTIIEDAVYGFLADDTPLAALGAGPLHRARQPVQEGRAGPRARHPRRARRICARA